MFYHDLQISLFNHISPCPLFFLVFVPLMEYVIRECDYAVSQYIYIVPPFSVAIFNSSPFHCAKLAGVPLAFFSFLNVTYSIVQYRISILLTR